MAQGQGSACELPSFIIFGAVEEMGCQLDDPSTRHYTPKDVVPFSSLARLIFCTNWLHFI